MFWLYIVGIYMCGTCALADYFRIENFIVFSGFIVINRGKWKGPNHLENCKQFVGGFNILLVDL